MSDFPRFVAPGVSDPLEDLCSLRPRRTLLLEDGTELDASAMLAEFAEWCRDEFYRLDPSYRKKNLTGQFVGPMRDARNADPATAARLCAGYLIQGYRCRWYEEGGHRAGYEPDLSAEAAGRARVLAELERRIAALVSASLEASHG